MVEQQSAEVRNSALAGITRSWQTQSRDPRGRARGSRTCRTWVALGNINPPLPLVGLLRLLRLLRRGRRLLLLLLLMLLLLLLLLLLH